MFGQLTQTIGQVKALTPAIQRWKGYAHCLKGCSMPIAACHRQSSGQRHRSWCQAAIGLCLTMMAYVEPTLAGTLEAIQTRKHVVCGVDENRPGFSVSSEKGWSGLAVDFCEALAAAVLGDAKAVKIIALTNDESVAALKNGTVDILPSSTVWSLNFEAELGLRFAGIIFFDGQGFMVRLNHLRARRNARGSCGRRLFHSTQNEIPTCGRHKPR
jgi:ABC-type amino acid transport substrate-binding protein